MYVNLCKWRKVRLTFLASLIWFFITVWTAKTLHVFYVFRFQFSISCEGEQWTGEGRKKLERKQKKALPPKSAWRCICIDSLSLFFQTKMWRMSHSNNIFCDVFCHTILFLEVKQCDTTSQIGLKIIFFWLYIMWRMSHFIYYRIDDEDRMF